MTLPGETGRNREHKLQPVATAPVFYPTTPLEFYENGDVSQSSNRDYAETGRGTALSLPGK